MCAFVHKIIHVCKYIRDIHIYISGVLERVGAGDALVGIEEESQTVAPIKQKH
jgi:hypothetical protein